MFSRRWPPSKMSIVLERLQRSVSINIKFEIIIVEDYEYVHLYNEHNFMCV